MHRSIDVTPTRLDLRYHRKQLSPQTTKTTEITLGTTMATMILWFDLVASGGLRDLCGFGAKREWEKNIVFLFLYYKEKKNGLGDDNVFFHIQGYDDNCVTLSYEVTFTGTYHTGSIIIP